MPIWSEDTQRNSELCQKRRTTSMSDKDDSEEYEYYIIHDGLGISHVMRHRKGGHPSIKCDDCD